MKSIILTTEEIQGLMQGETVIRRPLTWKEYHTGEPMKGLATSYNLGYVFTGVPKSGYCLYSRGYGGCWNRRTKAYFSPYAVGDELYVRETWAKEQYDNCIGFMSGICPNEKCGDENNICNEEYYIYAADEEPLYQMVSWHSPDTMPREAARLFPVVKDVKVEQLQDVNGQNRHDDLLKEAFEYEYDGLSSPIKQYSNEWDKRHPEYPYDTNPWTFAVTIELKEAEG